MADKGATPFPDNWAYIKTELHWLDRLLMLAVSRQRRENRDLDRLGKTSRDPSELGGANRATRHWWRGILSIDSPPHYDEGRPSSSGSSSSGSSPPASELSLNYQQTLEARIQISRQRGVVLNLPDLRDRLDLTLFEKNLILMGLAPEVNRRYGRLYGYLQETEAIQLPQLDLVLKLLCRNDQEWQTARVRLTQTSPLLSHGLIQLQAEPDQPLLLHSIKLNPALTTILLANPAHPQQLEQLLDPLLDQGNAQAYSIQSDPTQSRLHSPRLSAIPGPNLAADRSQILRRTPELPASASSGLRSSQPLDLGPPLGSSIAAASPGTGSSGQGFSGAGSSLAGSTPATWGHLVLPAPLLHELQVLAVRLQAAAHATPQPAPALAIPGTWAVLAGPSGTGKTLAAQAIAQTAGTPLTVVALGEYGFAQFPTLLHQLQRQAPTLLLLTQARRLFSASPAGLHPDDLRAELQRFWSQRRRHPCLTLLSLESPELLPRSWQTQCDRCLVFPLPDLEARQRLWKQAIPSSIQRDRLPWKIMARQWPLSGGQIQAIAQDAIVYAIAAQQPLNYRHIQQAWSQRHPLI